MNVRLWLGMLGALSLPAADNVPAHGLWVWKSSSVLEASHGAEKLRDFCQRESVNEVYVSVSANRDASVNAGLARLIGLLHRSNIRVEALLSSEDADEAGKHREKFLDHVRGIVAFNQRHSDRFDGIHLDIEPQQRPENKGAGNLRFLPGLVETFRDIRAEADKARLTVDADIQNKLLKGSLAERRMLMTSLPRLTLMMYELNSPGDGESLEKKIENVQTSSRKFLAMAYEGLAGPNLAKMSIALRTPDYAEELPRMLLTLDQANRDNPPLWGMGAALL